MVPTIYIDVHNKTIHSNQYSVTEHFKRAEIQQGQNMPGVFFFYDLSPIKVGLNRYDYRILSDEHLRLFHSCSVGVADQHFHNRDVGVGVSNPFTMK